MKRLPCLSLFIWFFWLISPAAFGASYQLESYPGARVVYYTNQPVSDYVLALSSYKKVAGDWLLDRSQRLKGQLDRYTLELPENHTAQNGFDFYLDQLRSQNSRELFYCKARDCGTSNSWANNHFKVLQLYGLDQYQQYAAFEVIPTSDKPVYVVLYVVQRGNRRVYLQVETLAVDSVVDLGVASSPESIISAMETDGYYVFPDLIARDPQGNTSINIKPAHIQALQDVLNHKPTWVLALVGHDYAAASLKQQQVLSLKYAQQIKTALMEKGIEAKRLNVYGLGSLAPAGRGDRSARVEIVKIDKE